MPGIIRPLLCAALFVLPLSATAARAQGEPATAPVATASAAPALVASAPAIAAPAPVQAEQAHASQEKGPVDYITPHITDSHSLEVPYWKYPYHTEWELPRFKPVEIGGVSVDLSITKHVFFMLLAAFCAIVLLVGAAMSSTAGHQMIGRPKGIAAAIEALALGLRNEVILPNVGAHGEKFVAFPLTLFFFVLFCNLWGLVPYGSTATGNISVTATLAIVTFIVVELTGIFTLGASYLGTLFYWNKELPMAVRVPMLFIMSPVEILGKLTKPFALAIRLFANMTAGHIVLLAIIGLIFSFGSWIAFPAPFLMAVAISGLELFVAFLQAFIFTLLASVFIGQMRVAHH
ncbi:MAG: F0F1 ATP synthase subunit A [Gemmatimonadaceae bacterium]